MNRTGASVACNLVKLARPRTWIFAASAWLTAYLSTGTAVPSICLIGVVICCLLTAATNLFNIYTDRAEDRVNLPHRIRMVEEIGLTRLKVSTAFCYVTPLLLSLMFIQFAHTIVCGIGVLNSILYSWGLRLKARLYPSLIALSGAVVLPFIAGWVAVRPIQEISPLILVLGLSFFAYANLKNLPDVTGDRQAGVRTVFTSFTPDAGLRLLVLLLLSPYALLGVLIWVGILPLKYWPAFMMLPLPLIIGFRIARCQSVEEREGIHALGYFHQLSFLLLSLTLYYPTVATIGSLGALFVTTTVIEYLGIDSRPYDGKLMLQGQPRYPNSNMTEMTMRPRVNLSSEATDRPQGKTP